MGLNGDCDWWMRVRISKVCTSEMNLWITTYMMQITKLTNRPTTHNERKEIISKFPKSTNNCLCSNCRYFRIFRGGT